jgi:hypothetical protein
VWRNAQISRPANTWINVASTGTRGNGASKYYCALF